VDEGGVESVTKNNKIMDVEFVMKKEKDVEEYLDLNE